MRAHATAAADPLHVEVDDPERFRFKTIEPVEVRVQSGGETTLDSVVVRFERAYVDASFVPEAGA